MPDPRHVLGLRAEAEVARALEARGWRVLARRWRAPEGELDLVCLDPGGVLVAIEVRARRSPRTGAAAETVSRTRVARLRRALLRFASEHPTPHRDLRLDLVCVEPVADGWRARRRPAIDAW